MGQPYIKECGRDKFYFLDYPEFVLELYSPVSPLWIVRHRMKGRRIPINVTPTDQPRALRQAYAYLKSKEDRPPIRKLIEDYSITLTR